MKIGIAVACIVALIALGMGFVVIREVGVMNATLGEMKEDGTNALTKASAKVEAASVLIKEKGNKIESEWTKESGELSAKKMEYASKIGSAETTVKAFAAQLVGLAPKKWVQQELAVLETKLHNEQNGRLVASTDSADSGAINERIAALSGEVASLKETVTTLEKRLPDSAVRTEASLVQMVTLPSGPTQTVTAKEKAKFRKNLQKAIAVCNDNELGNVKPFGYSDCKDARATLESMESTQ